MGPSGECGLDHSGDDGARAIPQQRCSGQVTWRSFQVWWQPQNGAPAGPALLQGSATVWPALQGKVCRAVGDGAVCWAEPEEPEPSCSKLAALHGDMSRLVPAAGHCNSCLARGVTLKPFPCCRTTRGQKRKLDDVHEDDDEHAGFDAAQLREHEEFTKVKNVAKIELGRYEMETWYFSPLPDEFKGCTVSACAAPWQHCGSAGAGVLRDGDVVLLVLLDKGCPTVRALLLMAIVP